MPELPEAETIARGLQAAVAGNRVRRVRVHRSEVVRPMTPAAFRRALTGRRIESVGRRAKWIAATLDDGGRWVTQLRMTGRFGWGPPPTLRAEPHLSLSVLFEHSDTDVLRFYDARRFARTQVLDPEGWAELNERLGIEPLTEDFTRIGNIYASEACYLAKVDPRRPAHSLDRGAVRRLHSAIRKVLCSAVRRRGTSLSDYRDVLGGEGTFQNVLDVYGRDNESCRRCGAEIVRVVLAGRSAFLCPVCQR
jgi:formamidopyrimidine-DNA glycosylase